MSELNTAKDAAPAARRAQIWRHRVERSRRFFVTSTTGTSARGMDYREREAWTRTITLPLTDLTARYQLLEDTPAHLLGKRRTA